MKEKLKEVREKKGFSQEQLADLVGMTQPNYSRRENGLKSITSLEWDMFAKKLGVEREVIYEEDNQNIIYKNIKKSPINNTGHIHYFNVPDFILKHLELLKEQNQELKEVNKNLREEILILKK